MPVCRGCCIRAGWLSLSGQLRTQFDTIVIDTPPVLSVADARILSRLADAVVLVLRAGQTTREAATMAMNVFEAEEDLRSSEPC